MLKHIFKLIWNRKGKNALMVLEIFLAFIILFSVMTFVIENYTNYNQPLGYEPETLWVSQLVTNELDSTTIVEIKRNLSRELLDHPNIENISFGGYMSPLGNSTSVFSNDDMGFRVTSHLFDADENFAETAGLKLTRGRWFNEEDIDARYEPIVITEKLYEDYFGGRELLDSIISISGEKKVIGFVETFNYRGKFDEEVPVSFRFKEPDNESVANLYLQIKKGVGVEFEEELTNLIADVSKLNNVGVEMITDRIKRDNRRTLIPMIALLSICGFLVLNVALGLFGVLWYNISKRKGEIGLRRALGAYKSQIMTQFITEILLIAFFGMGLACLFCIQVPLMDFFEIKDEYFYRAILASFLIITVLVLICALYPSSQAARISPAEALHEE